MDRWIKTYQIKKIKEFINDDKIEYKNLNNELKHNLDIITVSVKKDGMNLAYVPEKLLNLELCIEAVKENKNSFTFIPMELKKHHKIIEEIKKTVIY